MANQYTARLLAYAPNGAQIGSLPHPLSWEAAIPLNDMPSLNLVYPRNSPGEQILRDTCEVALTVRNSSGGISYTEPAGCRFLNIRRAVDLIDRPGTVSYTMPSYGWQLKKAHFAQTSKANKEGRIAFTNTSPGGVMRNILDEAKSRDNIPGMTYTFTNSVDSAGAAWPIMLTGEFDLGQDAWSILDSMARQGMCDWRFVGRELEIYAPDTALRRDLTNSPGITFHAGADTVGEPAERTWEELATRVIVTGDAKNVLMVTDNSGVGEEPWGKWEEVIQAGGMKGPAMISVGNRALTTKIRSRLQLTKQVVWRDNAPLPLLDYRPGDMIRAQNESTPQNEPLRIYQVTLSATDPYGVAIHLTLNDRFTDRALRQERWLTRVTGNSGPGAGGGTGVNPLPVPPEASGRIASKPTNVQVTATPYFSESGAPVGRAKVTWKVVTTGTDGGSMDMSRYIIYARRTDLPAQTAISAVVAHPIGAGPNDQVEGMVYPLDAGYTYEFKVIAVPAFNLPSDPSDPISLFIAYPTTPMPKPSAPILSSRLGTVKVEWNGLDSTGQPMPARLKEVQVQMKYGAGANDWATMGEIFVGGSSVIVTQRFNGTAWVNLAIGDSVTFRVTARDTAGNASNPPSDPTSISVVGVVGPDIAANSITANHIVAGSITAEKIKAYSLTVDRLSVGSETNMIADPQMSNQELREWRRDVGNQSTNTGGAVQWTVSSSSLAFWARIALVSANNWARFPLFNNVQVPLNTNLTTTPPPAIPVGVGTPVHHPVTGGGNLHGRVRVSIQQSTGAAWPAGASISVWMWARVYDRTGAWMQDVNIIPTYTTTTGAVTIDRETITGEELPTDAAFCIPVVTVETHNVPVNWTIAFYNPELWQENSIYIGDGMIAAPHIKANTITGDKMAADVIMANKYITGPWIRTDEPPEAPRVEISNQANYLGQPGIRLFGENNGPRSSSIFVTGATAIGGWNPYDFALTGPKTSVDANAPRTDLTIRLNRSFVLGKIFETTNSNSVQGGAAGTGSALELLLEGIHPRPDNADSLGNLYAMTRACFSGTITTAAGTGSLLTYTWGTSNGWSYRPNVTPILTTTNNYSPTVAARNVSATGFSVVVWNPSTASHSYTLQMLLWRGGSQL